MDDTISSHLIDDFDAAWQIVGQQYQPAILVTSALIKLTGGSERPVTVERLAAASGRTVDETLALARQFLKVNVQDGLVHLDLSAAGTPARYRLQIGGRRIDAGGCAPDIVWMALLAGTPIHAEATCPATGSPIRVDFTPDRVERVEPPSTVIAVISPLAPQLRQLSNREQAEADVCSQQPFFASAEAAADWQAQHLGGRIFPVREFFVWWHRFLSYTLRYIQPSVGGWQQAHLLRTNRPEKPLPFTRLDRPTQIVLSGRGSWVQPTIRGLFRFERHSIRTRVTQDSPWKGATELCGMLVLTGQTTIMMRSCSMTPRESY